MTKPERYRHKTWGLCGTLVEHNKTTGRVVLRLDNGRTIRTRMDNLRNKWKRED